MYRMTRESASKLLHSALFSAFLSVDSEQSVFPLGRVTCVQPHCLAWALLPGPPCDGGMALTAPVK